MTTPLPPAPNSVPPEPAEAPDPSVSPEPAVLPEPPAPPVAPAAGSRPARRFGFLTLVLVVVISAVGAGGTGYLIAARSHGGGAANAEQKKLYQCPMHPTIVQDHPGECPICGMKLVEVGAGSATERKIKFYRSPMDPRQTSPVPRKDEMGMDYVPVYEDEASADGASSVAGLATVDIDPARQQLIGLKTADVTRGMVSGTFRTIGRVAVDETRVRHVSVKVPVYVERVYVNFVGKAVRRGAPLFSGYSPELLAAQEEYRLALRTQKSLSGSSGFSVDSSGLVAAARRKLELWDLPKSAIARLEENGEARRTVTFHSPIAGVVIKKDVVDGMKLDEGAMPYEIVDLSRVWVLADIYETDLHRVQIGMRAKLMLKAYPNRVFEGKAAFVDPVLDPKTRTVKLRLEFPNPSGELKPELFGQVVLESADREALRVPEDAVIDAGERKVVFVALKDGKFQPREVAVGDSDGTNVEIISGLDQGEKVVVRANFLVDSESRLRASLAALSAAPPASAATPGSASASPRPKSDHAAHSGAPAGKASGASAKPSAKPKSGHAAHSGAPAKAAQPPAYACPMHPEVTDTKPSRCPKCGMVLERKKK